jgi:hypothetical protein
MFELNNGQFVINDRQSERIKAIEQLRPELEYREDDQN